MSIQVNQDGALEQKASIVGALALYLDTPENAEVAGGAGIAFTDDLAEKLRAVLSMPEQERESWRARAVARVREHYSWDAVTDAYENLLAGLVRR
jgi:glycosyltransferase involved in cell wall biosynthesis